MFSHGSVFKSAVLRHVRLVNPVLVSRPLMFVRQETTSTARIEEHGFESTKISDILKGKGKGADGSKVTLKAPTDYAFVNADDMTYTIDKDDTSTKTVYVQKSDQTVDNIVAGYPKNGYIKIYNASGKLNNDVVLSEGSSWIIDKTLTINGAEYYRVATNEYVKASDVYKYTPLQSIVTTKGVNVTPVYNSKGQLVIDLALDTNTPWYTDRSANIKGSEMYRVATDQWVKASDVTLNK